MKEPANLPSALAHFRSRTFVPFLHPLLLALALPACEDVVTEDSEALGGMDAATSAEPEPVDESEPEPVEEPPEEPPREGPEGCYLEESHVCDCDLDETECEGKGTWTAGCTSCAAQGRPDAGESEVFDAGDSSADGAPDAGVDAGPSAAVYGCYDPATHACSCDGDEASCVEAGGYWTDECTSCDSDEVVDGGVTDAGATDAGEWEGEDSGLADAAARDGGVVDAGAGSPGCYDPVTHACECAGDETSCTGAAGYWTDECGCP